MKRITGILHYLCKFMITSLYILLKMINVWTKVVGKINTILYSITIFRKSCRFGDNMEKYGIAGHATDDNIIWCMRITCRKTRAADTNLEYVILNAFP